MLVPKTMIFTDLKLAAYYHLDVIPTQFTLSTVEGEESLSSPCKSVVNKNPCQSVLFSSSDEKSRTSSDHCSPLLCFHAIGKNGWCQGDFGCWLFTVSCWGVD